MKIIKTDRRHAYGDQYKYALQFAGQTVWQIYNCAERKEYAKVFEKIYGPSFMKNPDYIPTMMYGEYMSNPNWKLDLERNRIYYQDESVLSMVMLMIPTVA
jgi:hypothetical protein